jgi:hypothetical protein
MKRYFVALIFGLLAACSTPTPQTTPQLVNVYVSSAAYPWVSDLYYCAPNSAVINLSDPLSADVTMRLGVPDHLTSPSFQISSEDVLVIVHPKTGVPSLTLFQVRSIFLGQVINWKELGGNDLPVQVWSFSPDEDVQGIFGQTVMNGQPITSLARLAVSGESMANAIGTNPGSVGILPRRLMTGAVQSVFTAAKAPVLIITKSTPEGSIEDLINCLQQEGH